MNKILIILVIIVVLGGIWVFVSARPEVEIVERIPEEGQAGEKDDTQEPIEGEPHGKFVAIENPLYMPALNVNTGLSKDTFFIHPDFEAWENLSFYKAFNDIFTYYFSYNYDIAIDESMTAVAYQNMKDAGNIAAALYAVPLHRVNNFDEYVSKLHESTSLKKINLNPEYDVYKMEALGTDIDVEELLDRVFAYDIFMLSLYQIIHKDFEFYVVDTPRPFIIFSHKDYTYGDIKVAEIFLKGLEYTGPSKEEITRDFSDTIKPESVIAMERMLEDELWLWAYDGFEPNPESFYYDDEELEQNTRVIEHINYSTSFLENVYKNPPSSDKELLAALKCSDHILMHAANEVDDFRSAWEVDFASMKAYQYVYLLWKFDALEIFNIQSRLENLYFKISNYEEEDTDIDISMNCKDFNVSNIYKKKFDWSDPVKTTSLL